MTGQYEEQNWSATGDSPQQPNYQPGNGSNSGQPTQSGSSSNSPGTAGSAAETGGSDANGGNNGSNGDSKQESGSGNGSGGKANGEGKKNGSAMSSELGDKTVAQVPDSSIASPSAADDGSGSSSLIWILIAVLALAGISGGVAMRMRANKAPE